MTEKKQRSRLQKRFARRLQILVLLSVCAVIFGSVFVFTKNYYSVRRIIILSDKSVEALRGVSVLYNRFLPTVSAKEVEESIINQNPLISKVKVEKVFPDTLRLTPKLLKPAVAVRIEGEYIVLAPNGRIITKVKEKPKGIPELIYYQKLLKGQIMLGDTIGFIDIVAAINFVNLVNTLGLSVVEVDIKGFYMIRLLLEGSRELLVTTEKNQDVQAYQIGAIVRQFKIEGKDFKTIDVRFDKPIVTFR